MKKRRTRKQKIGAKRQMVRVAQAPVNSQGNQKDTAILEPRLAKTPKKSINLQENHSLKLIKYDLLKTVGLSLLIFGIELSIYFWWN
jgi:hypothetical protein